MNHSEIIHNFIKKHNAVMTVFLNKQKFFQDNK